MDNQLKRYYRKKTSGGRSIVARAIDFVAVRAAMLIVIFIVMLQWSRSIKVSIPVAVLITVAVSVALILYRRRKSEKFFKKDMHQLQEKCLLESLTLMNDKEYVQYMERLLPGITFVDEIVNGFIADYKGTTVAILHNHPSSDCGVTKTVDIYRLCKDAKKCVIISLSSFTADAIKFAEKAEITLVSGKDILRIAGEKDMLPDEKVAEERAKQEMEDAIVSMERIKRSALSRTKIKAYIFCGLAAMVWPLVGGWRIYYPIISVLCFLLAVVSYKRGKHTQESANIDLT